MRTILFTGKRVLLTLAIATLCLTLNGTAQAQDWDGGYQPPQRQAHAEGRVSGVARPTIEIVNGEPCYVFRFRVEVVNATDMPLEARVFLTHRNGKMVRALDQRYADEDGGVCVRVRFTPRSNRVTGDGKAVLPVKAFLPKSLEAGSYTLGFHVSIYDVQGKSYIVSKGNLGIGAFSFTLHNNRRDDSYPQERV